MREKPNHPQKDKVQVTSTSPSTLLFLLTTCITVDPGGCKYKFTVYSIYVLDLYKFYCLFRWNPGKRPSAQQALKYPYFQTGGANNTTRITNGLIMEQTLQRSYARQVAALL